MITEFFIGLAAWVVGWIAGLFGEWTPPAELTQATSGLNDLMGTFASLGVWVSWPVLGACIAAAVGVWAAVLIVKLIRAVLAHIPAFGGSGD